MPFSNLWDCFHPSLGCPIPQQSFFLSDGNNPISQSVGEDKGSRRTPVTLPDQGGAAQ